MKNLEVHSYGVAQMTTREMRTTNGGVLGLDDILVGIVVGACIQIISDWRSFEDGLMGRPYNRN